VRLGGTLSYGWSAWISLGWNRPYSAVRPFPPPSRYRLFGRCFHLLRQPAVFPGLASPLREAVLRAIDLIVYPIAKLAEARRTQNADLAAETVAELMAMIRRSRAKVWNVGGILPWDGYEIAMETWRSLSEGDAE
jgi:hypothetical protein